MVGINFRVEEELKRKIERGAKSRSLDISEFIREIMTTQLNNQNNLPFIKETLQNIKNQAEKLYIDVQEHIGREISSYKERIGKLEQELKNIQKTKQEASKSIEKGITEIKKHFDYNLFIKRMETMDRTQLWQFYLKYEDKFKNKENIVTLSFQELKKVWESVKK